MVSDASRRKWAWVLKVFKERKKQRSEAVLKEDYSSESIIQEYIGLDVGLYIGYFCCRREKGRWPRVSWEVVVVSTNSTRIVIFHK